MSRLPPSAATAGGSAPGAAWSCTPLNLIAGEPSAPTVEIGVAEDPNTGEPVGALLGSEQSDIERGLAQAWRAWGHGAGPFSARGLPERVALLRRLAEQLDRRAETFAQAHASEVGVPITTARRVMACMNGLKVYNLAHVWLDR